MPEKKSNTPSKRLDDYGHFLNNALKPAFYANGFVGGFTATECNIMFKQNGVEKAGVTLPFPVVKSLAETLARMLIDYEKQFGQEILNMDELRSAYSKGVSDDK